MSDDDRMDRAERIRRMREGRRSDDGADGSDEAAGSDDTAGGDDPGGGDDPAGSDDPAGGDDRDGREPAEGEDDGSNAAGSSGVELDDETAAVVERVSRASAAVPDPQTMSEGETADEPDAVDGSDGGASDATGGGARTDRPADDGADAAEDQAGAGAGGSTAAAETRVLEFALGDEQYCLDIEYVEEIVKGETITRVPNTPGYVEGVVDLRGQITTILNPKVLIGAEETVRGDLLIVFDGEAFDEQGHLGWVVDDVRQVVPVTADDVTESPVDDEYVNGVVDRGDDGDLVVWTTPELALEAVT